MSFLSGIFGGAKSNSQAPAATGMPLQTSCYGKPISLVVGTTRIGCNLIDYENFKSIAVSAGSGGGKSGVAGGGGKGGGATSYEYNADVILALCEGPIDGIGNVWQSQTEETLADAGLSELPGSYSQASQNIYPYAGVACAEASQLSLGASAALPQFNFEVARTTGFNAVNGHDADPSLVVPWLLSDPFIGAGFPASRIGTLVSNSESHTIPGTPFSITVANAASFKFNLDVVDGAGNIFTCVPGTPAHRQYSFDPATGAYTFASGDAGTAVTIRYASLGALAAYQNFAMASGLWVSPGYDSQTQASAMLDNLATITYSEFVWSSGVLTLVPRGTVSLSGNGYSYTAAVTPLFDLSDDDFLPNTNVTGTANAGTNDDPVIVTRSRPSDQINDIKLEFLDRSNQYAPGIAEVTDQANIDAFGKRASASSTAHEFADAKAANTSAQLQMQDQYIRNTASITLDQRYCILDPMDVVSIADPELFPNAPNNAALFRILEITENDDGTLSINLEELPVAAGAAAEYSLNTGVGYIANYNLPPGPVNPPIVFGMPTALAANQVLSIGVALSGSNPANWLGCYVYKSSDGDSFRVVGKQIGPARMGVTSADFPAGADPDTTDTLGVDLSESAGALASGTHADADSAINTLCLVGGGDGIEYLSYSTATLISASHYALGTYLRRGQYNSAIVDHPTGSPFARLDDGIFQIPYQAAQIGQPLFLKFASFNLYEGGQESLAGVTAYEVVLPAPPPPPDVTGFTAQQNGNVIVFGWNQLDYPTIALAGFYIGYAPAGTTDWSEFKMLTEAGAGTEMTNAEVPPGSWVFGIRAASLANVPGTAIGLSPGIATFNLTVVATDNDIYQDDEAPMWDGTAVNFVRHYTGVLTPKGSKTVNEYAALSPPASPTLSQVAGGALGAATYYVVVTYVSNTGETLSSGGSSIAVAADYLVSVADPSGGSPPATAVGWNVYASTSSGIGAETRQNATPIPFGANWTSPVTGLVAGAALPTSNTTGWDVFDIFVADPVPSASYTTATIDTGYDDDLRVYAETNYGLGFGESGTPALGLAIDTWLTGASDPGVYTPWTVGFVELRYLKAQLTYYPIVAGDVAYITDFTPTIDTAPTTENAGNFAVAIGGSTLTFAPPYHTPPFMPAPNVLTPTGAGYYASATDVTATAATITIFNSAGASVAGSVSWTAIGE